MEKIQLTNGDGWFDLDSCKDNFHISIKVDELYYRKFDVFRTEKDGFVTRSSTRVGGDRFKKSTLEEIELWKNEKANQYAFPPEEEV